MSKEVSNRFNVKVAYGFLPKLKIVLLGEVLDGEVKDGMWVQVLLDSGSVIGSWQIIEVLHMDFINQNDVPNYKGLMLKCKNEEDFKLLQSLRVYDEVVHVIPDSK
jgi:hypothetical protein